MRSALGAGRWQLAKEQLIESVLLSDARRRARGCSSRRGGWRHCARFAPVELQALIDPTPDWRVLAFTGAVALLTGVAFGVGPALQSARGDLAAGMREGGRGVRGLARPAPRAQRARGERDRARLRARGRRGAAREGVRAGAAGARGVRAAAAWRRSRSRCRRRSIRTTRGVRRSRTQVLTRIGALPGVAAAGAISRLPLNPGASRSDLKVEGREQRRDDPNPDYLVATPGYFRSLAIPLVARARLQRSRRRTARRRWRSSPRPPRSDSGGPPTCSASGSRSATRRWREIVGVVADVRQHELDRQPIPAVYIAVRAGPVERSTRSPCAGARGAPRSSAPIEREIHAVDAGPGGLRRALDGRGRRALARGAEVHAHAHRSLQRRRARCSRRSACTA